MPKQYAAPQAFSTRPRPPIPLQPTPKESNQVKDHGYDSSTRTLALRFTRGAGAIYHYPDFPAEMYRAFLEAESHGKYFGEHIKHLPFEKFPPEPSGELPTLDDLRNAGATA